MCITPGLTGLMAQVTPVYIQTLDFLSTFSGPVADLTWGGQVT